MEPGGFCAAFPMTVIRINVSCDVWNVTIMRTTHLHTYVWRKKHNYDAPIV